jgi:hypothetical protein
MPVLTASCGPPQNPDRRFSTGHRDQWAGSLEFRPRLTTGLHQSPEITSGFVFDVAVSLTTADGTEDSIC